MLGLLFLLCSVSATELYENNINGQSKVSPGVVSVQEQPQLCPADVHAVLREMSVKLAENRLMIQQLQTLCQEQAGKLKELQSQVDTQHHGQQAQATELNELKTRTDVNENQVESLISDRTVGRVAFSAGLLASGSGFIGPFNTYTSLAFKRVISNIGNAYNPNSGFFTAPVRGAYHFELYTGAHGDLSKPSGVVLVKNGEHIFTAWEHQSNGYGTSANGATLILNVGDVVYLRLWHGTRIFDNDKHHSSFSGHLLFPM